MGAGNETSPDINVLFKTLIKEKKLKNREDIKTNIVDGEIKDDKKD